MLCVFYLWIILQGVYFKRFVLFLHNKTAKIHLRYFVFKFLLWCIQERHLFSLYMNFLWFMLCVFFGVMCFIMRCVFNMRYFVFVLNTLYKKNRSVYNIHAAFTVFGLKYVFVWQKAKECPLQNENALAPSIKMKLQACAKVVKFSWILPFSNQYSSNCWIIEFCVWFDSKWCSWWYQAESTQDDGAEIWSREGPDKRYRTPLQTEQGQRSQA